MPAQTLTLVAATGSYTESAPVVLIGASRVIVHHSTGRSWPRN